jgi:Arc/MetJ-type ribon-helix-helix transcriptional regulator
MTIHLPEDLGRCVREEVLSGRYSSADEAVVQIVRAYFRNQAEAAQSAPHAAAEVKTDSLLGMWRDAAEELDGIVADAMKRRRDEPWRAVACE